MYQLISDLKDLFADTNLIKTYLSDYNGEYAKMMIKEIYEENPAISYPNITIEEIENSDSGRYHDDGGEFATSLGYQFNVSCKQTEKYTATQNVRRVLKILDTFFKGNTYKCFTRSGNSAILPNSADHNIKTGYTRYTCNLVSSQNTIYRRY